MLRDKYFRSGAFKIPTDKCSADSQRPDSISWQSGSSGSLTNPFQYTARESDPETGLYYYRARYYDPNVGRFASEDPIRFKGGNNFYPYAHNNPAVLRDPTGNDPGAVAAPWWGWLTGAAEGGSVWLGHAIGAGIGVALQLTVFAPSVARDARLLVLCVRKWHWQDGSPQTVLRRCGLVERPMGDASQLRAEVLVCALASMTRTAEKS
jgi:RHS repeat-associated protein